MVRMETALALWINDCRKKKKFSISRISLIAGHFRNVTPAINEGLLYMCYDLEFSVLFLFIRSVSLSVLSS